MRNLELSDSDSTCSLKFRILSYSAMISQNLHPNSAQHPTPPSAASTIPSRRPRIPKR